MWKKKGYFIIVHMDDLIRQFNRRRKLRKFLYITIAILDILAIIAGFVLLIVFAMQGNQLANVFGGISGGLFVISLIVFFVVLFRKDKLIEQLYSDIETGDFTAEEILQIGAKTKINLFNMALVKRCKELGLKSVPEWCVRDGVLPERNDFV